MDYKNKNYNSRPVAIVIAKLLIYHNPCLKQVDSRNILFSFLFEEGNVPFKKYKNQQKPTKTTQRWKRSGVSTHQRKNHLKISQLGQPAFGTRFVPLVHRHTAAMKRPAQQRGRRHLREKTHRGVEQVSVRGEETGDRNYTKNCSVYNVYIIIQKIYIYK